MQKKKRKEKKKKERKIINIMMTIPKRKNCFVSSTAKWRIEG